MTIRSLSDHDYDDNEEVRKNKWFYEQNNMLFGTFLWHPLNDHDVKFPDATFYGGHELSWTYDNKFSFPFLNLDTIHKNSTTGTLSPTFNKIITGKRVEMDAIKLERKQIHFFSDVCTASSLLLPKLPMQTTLKSWAQHNKTKLWIITFTDKTTTTGTCSDH